MVSSLSAFKTRNYRHACSVLMSKLIFSSASNKTKHDFPLMWEIIDGEYKELRRIGELLYLR